jgi:hypothetical protein
MNRAAGTDDPEAIFVGQRMIEADADFVFGADRLGSLVVDFLGDHF